MIIFSYLLYYLVIIPVSLLPFPVLYLLSDLLYVVLFYGVSYRKKVVVSNLENSFPDKSKAEINKIASLFYRHFCDVIVESLKSFTISDYQISKRMVLQNPELLNGYYKQGRSIILAGGHYNNWEWIATSIDKQIDHKAIAIYKTLSNKFFDSKMRATRSKFGLLLVSTKRVAETFEKYKDEPSAIIFAIDQSPGNPAKCHWMNFLNQDTAVLYGTEKYAKEYNYPVLFGTIHKVKRGFYTLKFTTLTDHPQETAPGYITETATKSLEKEIIAAPQYWLWTHKRWKNKRNKV
jgi:Kdo2-lipid IVA lauroyltransferase/acyltransferase